MRKEIYYKYSDALRAAKKFADKNNGTVTDRPAYGRQLSADDKEKFNYKDDRVEAMSWSGETSAIAVLDSEYHQIGLFAFWDSDE